jgi:hypothetical protein
MGLRVSVRRCHWFDRRIRAGRRDELPAAIRQIAEQIDAGRAVGLVVRPTPTFSWIPFGITMFLFLLWLTLLAPLVDVGWRHIVPDGPLWHTAAMAAGLALAVGLIVYYTLWINLFGPLWLKRRLDRHFLHVGSEGVLRRDGHHYVFVPWAAVAGAWTEIGTVYMDDHGERQQTLDLRLAGRSWLTVALVKGYGPGILFQDWIEYAEDDLRRVERQIAALLRDAAAASRPDSDRG